MATAFRFLPTVLAPIVLLSLSALAWFISLIWLISLATFLAALTTGLAAPRHLLTLFTTLVFAFSLLALVLFSIVWHGKMSPLSINDKVKAAK